MSATHTTEPPTVAPVRGRPDLRSSPDDFVATTQPVRVAAAADTPEAALRVLPTTLGGTDWRTRPLSGAYAFRFLVLGDDRVRLGRSQLRGYVRGTLAPSDDYVVSTARHGDVIADLRTSTARMEHGSPTLWSTDRSVVLEAFDHDIALVHLDRSFVRSVAGARSELPDGELRINPYAPPTAAALDAWRAAVDAAPHVLEACGIASAEWDDAVHAIADAFLELLPPDTGPVPGALLTKRSARMRQAFDYVHAHLHDPITLSELTRASGLSPRGVQEGFQRVFGMSPMTYHRFLRLEQAREELLRSTPETTTVAEVARRWGFAHLGRFSAEYARQFGDYPKSTLRR
ncbi:AraC family transcriptional regulator [Curtobacterium pusillum]|uniref:AraC family transcriptional regulator n=1 Tax=Curtobacterium pusillum TaxID=69373 RepID=UPI00119D19B1|nr:AraC family transcriptional regulator [Curtobacterium pusillum]